MFILWFTAMHNYAKVTALSIILKFRAFCCQGSYWFVILSIYLAVTYFFVFIAPNLVLHNLDITLVV